MAIEGALGGFFSSLGYVGSLITVLGAIVFTVAHGFFAGMVANKLAVVPGAPTKDEYEKAEIYMSAVSVLPVGFGIWRMQTVPGENDTLDAVGCFLGGGLLFEVVNMIEIAMSKLGVAV